MSAWKAGPDVSGCASRMVNVSTTQRFWFIPWICPLVCTNFFLTLMKGTINTVKLGHFSGRKRSWVSAHLFLFHTLMCDGRPGPLRWLLRLSKRNQYQQVNSSSLESVVCNDVRNDTGISKKNNKTLQVIFFFQPIAQYQLLANACLNNTSLGSNLLNVWFFSSPTN